MPADGGVRPHNPQGRARHRAAPTAAPCLAVTAPKAPGPAERSEAALQLPALKQSAFPTSGTFRLRAGRFLPVSPCREPRTSAPNPFTPQRRPPRPAPRGAAAPRAAGGCGTPPHTHPQQPPGAAPAASPPAAAATAAPGRPCLTSAPPRCAAPAPPGPGPAPQPSAAEPGPGRWGPGGLSLGTARPCSL